MCLSFLAGGKYVGSGGADGTVRDSEVATDTELKHSSEYKSAVCGVAFSLDGRYIASCGDTIKLWDLQQP